MSVDDRVRGALRDQAEAFDPPVESALERVRTRGRGAGRRRAAAAVLATAASVAVVVGAVTALGERVADVPPTGPPTASPSTTGTPAAPLRGTISADVTRPATLAGPWTLRLGGNGTMDVSAPPGVDASGPLFTADEVTFRTTLFRDGLCSGDGSGIYEWLRVGDRVEFRVVSDLCPARARFFTESTWTVSTGSAADD